MKKDLLPSFENGPRKDIKVYKFENWSFLDFVRNFSMYNTKELVMLYGIFGGCVRYLSYIDTNKSVQDNIIDLILTRNSPLFEEAESYISQELREISTYTAILYEIAQGKHKLNDLYEQTGFSRAKILVYLKNLAAFDIIEKVQSFETSGWDQVQKGIYIISNHFVNFWFKFVYGHKSQLAKMEPRAFYEKYIARSIEEYLSTYFAKVCKEYLMLMDYSNQLPLKISKFSPWIGKKGNLDIVAQDLIRQKLVAKCYWQERLVSANDFKDLLEITKQAKIEANYYYLFALDDFDLKLKSLAQKLDYVKLIRLTDF